MENQTTELTQQRPANFGEAREWRLPRERTLEHISPMRLSDLLWKTNQVHHGLSQTEKATLTVLITFVNFQGIARNGYEAYPSGDWLVARTGLSLRTIEGNRKILERNGWIKIHTGRGRGHANHYFINGRKIVDAYNRSNPESKIEIHTENAFDAIKSKSSVISRDTRGLRRGRGRTRAIN